MKTKIRQDKWGLYVRTDGRLLRPILPIGYAHINPNLTVFKAGETVNTRAIPGSELGRVNNEAWFTHGSYLGVKDTSTLYKPSHHRWSDDH
jgi:hypothetical protein